MVVVRLAVMLAVMVVTAKNCGIGAVSGNGAATSSGSNGKGSCC